MKKLLLGFLILGSAQAFSKEVCSVDKKDFDKYTSVTCTSIEEGAKLVLKLSAQGKELHEVRVIKTMLSEGYDLKAAYRSDDNSRMNWVFVK